MAAIISASSYLRLKDRQRLRRFLNGPVATARSPEDLPKTIFMLWDAGRDNAPPLCEMCIRSWEALNPEWTVKVLNAAEADTLVPRAELPQSLGMAGYSDLVRTAALRKHGGVWADATLLCMKPVEQWLPWLMAQSDFFLFSRPGPDRLVSSWFIASQPGSAVLGRLLEEAKLYWSDGKDKAPPYFWFHYLFEYLCAFDREFREAWAGVPRISADPLHVMQQVFAGEREREEALPILRHTPVQKLSYKMDVPIEDYRQILADIEWPWLDRL